MVVLDENHLYALQSQLVVTVVVRYHVHCTHIGIYAIRYCDDDIMLNHSVYIYIYIYVRLYKITR